MKTQFRHLLIFSIVFAFASCSLPEEKTAGTDPSEVYLAEIIDIEEPVVVYEEDTIYITSFARAKDTMFTRRIWEDLYTEIPFRECNLRYFGNTLKPYNAYSGEQEREYAEGNFAELYIANLSDLEDNIELYDTFRGRRIYRFIQNPDKFMLILEPSFSCHGTLHSFYSEDDLNEYDRYVTKTYSDYIRTVLPLYNSVKTNVESEKLNIYSPESYPIKDIIINSPKVITYNGVDYVLPQDRLDSLKGHMPAMDSLETMLYKYGYKCLNKEFTYSNLPLNLWNPAHNTDLDNAFCVDWSYYYLEEEGHIGNCPVYRFKLQPESFIRILSPSCLYKHWITNGFDAYTDEMFSAVNYESAVVPIYNRWDKYISDAKCFYFMKHLCYEAYSNSENYSIWDLIAIIFVNSISCLLIGTMLLVSFLVWFFRKKKLRSKCLTACLAVTQFIVTFIITFVVCFLCFCEVWKSACFSEIMTLTATLAIVKFCIMTKKKEKPEMRYSN